MHRKGHKTQRRTKHKRAMKGGFYGASGAIAPGAMGWSAGSEMGDYAISRRGGNTMIGARRKKKSTRKNTRRKHRGGSKYGAVAASYQGTGSRGIIDVVGVNTKGPAGSPAYGEWNNKGAQPGSGHDSFVRAH
jgi:hypothetical protein